eukprot:g72299.t1
MRVLYRAMVCSEASCTAQEFLSGLCCKHWRKNSLKETAPEGAPSAERTKSNNQTTESTNGICSSCGKERSTGSSASRSSSIVSHCKGANCVGDVVAGFCALHRPKSRTLGGSFLKPAKFKGAKLNTGDEESEASPAPLSPKEFRDPRLRSAVPSSDISGTAQPLRRRARSIVDFEASQGNSSTSGQVLERFLEAAQAMSTELNPARAALVILNQTCSLLSCEQTVLYFVENNELMPTLNMSEEELLIRIPKDKGLAGHAASWGKVSRMDDPSKDPRFDDTMDKYTGRPTRNALAAPIQNFKGTEVVAVLECTNKMMASTFTSQDEVLLENVAAHCSIVLRNADLFLQQTRAEEKVKTLLELITTIYSNPDIHSLIFTLNTRTSELCNADRASLYLVDRTRQNAQLVVVTGEVNIRLPIDKGIAGAVAMEGTVISIPDCYKDARFNQAVDKKTGYRTTSMLCMPIFGDDESDPATAKKPSGREVIGVLQLLNKQDQPHFGPEDEAVLGVLLRIAGPIIKRTNTLFSKKSANSSPRSPSPLRSYFNEVAVPPVGKGTIKLPIMSDSSNRSPPTTHRSPHSTPTSDLSRSPGPQLFTLGGIAE